MTLLARLVINLLVDALLVLVIDYYPVILVIVQEVLKILVVLCVLRFNVIILVKNVSVLKDLNVVIVILILSELPRNLAGGTGMPAIGIATFSSRGFLLDPPGGGE